ncbi:MAG TPA: hypothetical protein VMU89_05075 [Thermomicrobiaceae bacterium]|nr:hypothetical protein [Thermomicrobiaceae bacterium]
MSGSTGEQQSAVAAALSDAVLVRYGDRLDEAGVAKVRGEVEELVKAAEALRAYRLTNADEPDFVFRAYRRES